MRSAFSLVNKSRVNLKYNDSADSLGKEGTTMPQANVEPLTYLELYSRRKAFVNISWRHPPADSWYRSEGPGATIHFKGERAHWLYYIRVIFCGATELVLEPSEKAKFNCNNSEYEIIFVYLIGFEIAS
ncbi:hypothetical protein AVEN_103748-1 [Araneus ventricosus]|uniref:Uncharacterized protein n=1 Tax=Araneus ventricosus TaxID=182803 RepID=A0A4Y2QHI0_ARAVE|nr:hypothetical protein AVEN_103748-1 [Araneus ventricosus]